MYEFGRPKNTTCGYSSDDVIIVPVWRTCSEPEVNLCWCIDAITFDAPVVVAPMDSVMSPATATEMGCLGGLGAPNLEDLWTRYEDPFLAYEQLTEPADQVTTIRRLQQSYAEPIRAELIEAQLAEARATGVPVAGAFSPARTQQFADAIERAGVDFFAIRGTTISIEHVDEVEDTLNLKESIHRFDAPVLAGSCATYRIALRLVCAGAIGALVGFGGGATHTTTSVLGIEVPMVSAVVDVMETRRDYLEESDGCYVRLIADGAVGRSGDIAKAITCGVDAVMVGSPLTYAAEAPGRGWHQEPKARHATLSRNERVFFEQAGSLAEVVSGPSYLPDGTMNLVGGLRKVMAFTGYTDIKFFQRADVMVH